MKPNNYNNRNDRNNNNNKGIGTSGAIIHGQALLTRYPSEPQPQPQPQPQFAPSSCELLVRALRHAFRYRRRGGLASY